MTFSHFDSVPFSCLYFFKVFVFNLESDYLLKEFVFLPDSFFCSFSLTFFHKKSYGILHKLSFPKCNHIRMY